MRKNNLSTFGGCSLYPRPEVRGFMERWVRLDPITKVRGLRHGFGQYSYRDPNLVTQILSRVCDPVLP